jgi:N-acetylglucosamine kinase-like BadF-type ATPase
MTIVLGVDGGGRKTHAVVADATGSILGTGEGAGSNWELVGLSNAVEAITSATTLAVEEAGIAAGEVEAAVFGLAGIDWPSDVSVLEEALAHVKTGGQRRLVNDAFVALRAGCPQPWGVVVIAGTGTIAAGRDPAGNEYRTIGQGRVFGDYGSEFDVSELAVRAVANEYTGRGPSTMLTELLCARNGVTTGEELLELISRADSRMRSPEVTNMTPLVLQATEAGDLVSRGILEEIGHALGETAGHVAAHLDMRELDFKVVLSGGLFRAPNRYMLDELELGVRRTAPRASLTILETEPVVGALLMALELATSVVSAGVSMSLSRAALERFRHSA